MGKFLLVIAVFGAVVYTLFWLLERRRRTRYARGATVRPAPQKRALGPDDDEEFLRALEQRRRRAAHEREKRAKPGDDKPAKGQSDQPGTSGTSGKPGSTERDPHPE